MEYIMVSEKYFELQNQLSYVKDFIIWKQSFSQYFKLFTNFKNGLIDGEWFVDEFFDIFNEDKELLKNFVFNSESFKKGLIKSMAGYFKTALVEDFQPNLSSKTVAESRRRDKENALTEEKKQEEKLSQLKKAYDYYENIVSV